MLSALTTDSNEKLTGGTQEEADRVDKDHTYTCAHLVLPKEVVI